MRTVLDANILISFLLTKGPTISQILNYWEQKKFILLVSEEILLEIYQVLERMVDANSIKSKEASALYRRLKQEGELVSTLSQIALSPEKKDNRYLELSLDGEANYLVTGDKKHLLKLKKINKTKIISPKEFINIVKNSR